MEQNSKQVQVNKRWENIEFNRFGIAPVLLIFQSCLASVAVCYILKGSDIEQLVSLSLVSFTTMAANAGVIMVLPMKWIIGLSAVSVLFSIITLTVALL